MSQSLRVEVAFALPTEQVLLTVDVPAGATVETAIRASGVVERCPALDRGVNRVGIFGKLARLDTPLREGDRVEIYRPLTVDPKEARRRRVEERRKARGNAG